MAEQSKNKPVAWNPPSMIPAAPSYKQVSTIQIQPGHRFITLAGQTGTQPDGTCPEGFIAQVRSAYKNVHEGLKAAGCTPRDVIFVRHYIVVDSGDEKLNELAVVERGWAPLWEEFMDNEGEGHRPPDTVLGVSALALKHLLYEVECWAIAA